MSKPRDDRLYLADIVAACDSIAQFIREMNEKQFVANELVRSAVLQKLTIIGEAASNITQPVRDTYPSIPVDANPRIAQHRGPLLFWCKLGTYLGRCFTRGSKAQN